MAAPVPRSSRHSFIPSFLTNSIKQHDEEETIATEISDEPISHEPNTTEGGVKRERTRRKGNLVSSVDQLALFRTLVGIDNPPGLHASTFFRSHRPAPNVGIYGRVVAAESKAHRQHRLFSFLISTCLGAQILVAATLTALGAGNGPRSAVTVFGAINTIIAGFLAYLKGSGLPNRMKYYENEWTKVREYIEQRERDFCRENCTLDLEAEILIIERMYEEVKGDIEANTPDSFVSVRDMSKRSGTINPGPAIAKASDMAHQAADNIRGRLHETVDPASRSVASLSRNLSYQGSQMGEKINTAGEKASGYGDKITGFVERPISIGVSVDPKITSKEKSDDYKA